MAEDPRLEDNAPDQLSPDRALANSLGSSRSQRVGDSGPIANPTVSFPDEPAADEAAPEQEGAR